MTRFPFDPPSGWVPSSFVDEIAPTPRKTPDDWICRRYALDGSVVLAGPNEAEDENREKGRVLVSRNEVVSFDACFRLGTVKIRIKPDGSWEHGNAIPDAATVFWQPGYTDTIEFTMDDFAREWAEAHLSEASAPTIVTVECLHWVDDVRFVLGRRDMQSELTFIPVQSVGGRFSEEVAR